MYDGLFSMCINFDTHGTWSVNINYYNDDIKQTNFQLTITNSKYNLSFAKDLCSYLQTKLISPELKSIKITLMNGLWMSAINKKKK